MPLLVTMALFINSEIIHLLTGGNCTHIIPIPTSSAHLRKRGFNQANLIAQELGTRYNVPVTNIIHKRKEAQNQTGNNRKKRLTLSQDSFYLSHTVALPEITSTLVLIDDICTTGATLRACATLLMNHGFNDIRAITLFRGKSVKGRRNPTKDCMKEIIIREKRKWKVEKSK